jgi:hypothetical protein
MQHDAASRKLQTLPESTHQALNKFGHEQNATLCQSTAAQAVPQCTAAPLAAPLTLPAKIFADVTFAAAPGEPFSGSTVVVV